MKSIRILILVSFLISCGNKTESKPEEQSVQEQPKNLVLSKVQLDSDTFQLGKLLEYNFGEIINVTGMIDVPPQNKSMISTFVAGYIYNTPLLVGDFVSKGQLLVALQNPEYIEIQQNYIEIGEQLVYLKSEYQRQKTLFDENITSEKNYLKAQSLYKSNLAHFNSLKKKLQMMNISPTNVEAGNISSVIKIYAPIEGYVTKVNVSNGAYVSPNDVILEIVDTEHIHLELSVFEKDIMKVKKGQKIEFKIPEASDDLFQAEVHLVGTTIDQTTRRVKVHGHVDNEKNQFIVGMYVNAEILVNVDSALGLPMTAIIKDGEASYVYAVKDKKEAHYDLEKFSVDLGKTAENYVEILNVDQLKDKMIVLKGADKLVETNSTLN
ncbi:efflux RND transporter periplasmic adaptor subunit [Winogradskyella aurantia]|uniref:Efflux transporter periplasmic adaptor subunit n=1 Tax=Winogradskyella aurantia TaxID=1915063 RepID=A0A265UZ91_9FLAO|nr:efflux RND transporter periplasmic adaptor subunit [Winogradskyella aurantia]OZV70634.1 efflux transporter periplasmic adaptor subunit [Winogradskyella aurantia]